MSSSVAEEESSASSDEIGADVSAGPQMTMPQRLRNSGNVIDSLMSSAPQGLSSIKPFAVPRDSSTPLFVSSRSVSSEPRLFDNIWVDEIPEIALEVRVPPFQADSDDYPALDFDLRVEKILKRLGRRGGSTYFVRTLDGHIYEFTFDEVAELSGGLEAIESFEKKRARSSSESHNSDEMVSTRQHHAKRQRDRGFIDTMDLDLSDDEPRLRPTKRTKIVLKINSTSQSRMSESGESEESTLSSEESGSRKPTRRRKLGKEKRKGVSNTKELRGSKGVDYGEPTYFAEMSESSQSGSGPVKRGRGRPRQITEPIRRSDRARNHLVGSMRELLEDEIPEIEIRSSGRATPKLTAIKEYFKDLPRKDPFVLRHCSFCDVCNKKSDVEGMGQLVFCQGCTFSYHVSCLGRRNARNHLVTKIGDQDFVLQCQRCVDYAARKEATAPRQSRCQECGVAGRACKPFRSAVSARDEQKEREKNMGVDPITSVSPELINNPKNVLFRCSSCYQAFHMHHLPAQTENIIETEDEDTKAAARFSVYCESWLCDDCLKAPAAIGSIITWRPYDPGAVTANQKFEDISEDLKEYLIKWFNKSYYRSVWKRGAWVWARAAKAMRIAFARKENVNIPTYKTEDAIPEDFLRVDIVFDIKYNNVLTDRIEEVDVARIKEVETALVKYKGLGYDDVVWEGPPDPQDTERWADWKAAYEEWVRGCYLKLPSTSAMSTQVRRIRAAEFEKRLLLEEQPESLKGKLMEYQLEGLNWLLYKWHQAQNAILADEMGLGKTVQIVAMILTLKEKCNCAPVLVVVPNATCANWRREIKRWAPSLRVVMYFGSSRARELTQTYELHPKKRPDLGCHVVVTSYEAAQDQTCQRFFKSITWAALVVDEGQRLKNDENILYNALLGIKTYFKVLLTGTPLQNNQRELFNLLQFLDESKDAAALGAKYETITKENVPELHEIIRPFFLRRTKAQVLTSLPPMAQIIVPVTMSPLTKKLYKSILAKNADLIKSIFGGDKKGPLKGLRNLLMQLRKCLCHPFVYSLEIEERTTEAAVSHRRLVEASSKLQLLEIMLPKLKERGHRVLIFSQFLDMLTIVEDFLDGLGLEHVRLDGNLGSLEKQKLIDRYNETDSTVFAFLLSTRAGGVGINLATADTVIILDPDFNPHQDIQAISRAHRIGQEKKVLVFQIMTRDSAEEKVLQIGKKKMALDHVLIEAMDADESNEVDLESVLRHGAEALFKENGLADIVYDSASIEKLLDRSQVEDTKGDKDHSAESQFSFARVWQNDSGSMVEQQLEGTSDDENRGTALWTKILDERARQAENEARLKSQALGRGKRQRRTIDYSARKLAGLPEEEDYSAESDRDADFEAQDREGGNQEEREDSIEPEELRDPDVPRTARDADGVVSPAPVQTATPAAPQPGHQKASPKVPKKAPANDTPQTPGQAGEVYWSSSNETGLMSTGYFKRATEPRAIAAQMGMPDHPPAEPCMACGNLYGPHAQGSCPLRIAGPEFCNLCGLAHFGYARTCPHLSNEIQVGMMLRALRQSNEPRELVELAKKKLLSIKGSLVKDSKAKAAKKAQEEQQMRQFVMNHQAAGGGLGPHVLANNPLLAGNLGPTPAPPNPHRQPKLQPNAQQRQPPTSGSKPVFRVPPGAQQPQAPSSMNGPAEHPQPRPLLKPNPLMNGDGHRILPQASRPGWQGEQRHDGAAAALAATMAATSAVNRQPLQMTSTHTHPQQAQGAQNPLPYREAS